MDRPESITIRDHNPSQISPPFDPDPAVPPKDGARPKRKKARRACMACQRAHLTCGDERPCERCVKRGLQDSCHNGMKKKAKYLHDADLEDMGDEVVNETPSKRTALLKRKESSREEVGNGVAPRGTSGDGGVAGRGFAGNNAHLGRGGNATLQEHSTPALGRMSSSNGMTGVPKMSFDTQLTPTSNDLQGVDQGRPDMATTYDQPYFNPNDPNFFFDTSNLDFGNHYGALEFGMLGQMSSGAGVAGDMFMAPPQRQQSYTYDQPGFNAGFLPLNAPLNNMARSSVTDWQTNPQSQGLTMNSWNPTFTPADMSLEPHAFTIGAVPTYNAMESSPSSIDYLLRYEDQYLGPTDGNNTELFQSPPQFLRLTEPSTTPNQTLPNRHRKTSSRTRVDPGPPPSRTAASTPAPPNRKLDLSRLPLVPTPPHKRHRDPSTIYSSTTTPYPYTLAFHALTSVLSHRFTASRRLRIARSLASIRPSFISCTRTLIEDDLIFMEKCFQRQLLEYEEFVEKVGTPTVVCRRTGEVAAVGKEFCLLTGWEREVLLGVRGNGNENLGVRGRREREREGGMSGTSSRAGGVVGVGSVSGTGAVTPRYPNTTTAGEPNASTSSTAVKDKDKSNPVDSSKETSNPNPTQPPRQQPVFLAELLDDDSVVRFYEDFAKLAFADSKGSAWRPCKLLKYRTREEVLRRGLEREKRRERERERVKEREDRADIGGGGGGGEGGERVGREGRGRGEAREGREGRGLGEKEKEKEKDDDVVDCMYCWTVKRDVFDIPMMIVINFLPLV